MTQFRKNRLESEIAKETSLILLQEVRDPRLGFVTVTRAKVSDDYRYAKVFVSIMGKDKEKKLSMKGLQHAQGFVQAELSRRIKMRSFPEIRFELDESIDKAFKMTKLLDEIAKKRAAGAAASAAEKEEE
jgi:ribosome-binding factor A